MERIAQKNWEEKNGAHPCACVCVTTIHFNCKNSHRRLTSILYFKFFNTDNCLVLQLVTW